MKFNKIDFGDGAFLGFVAGVSLFIVCAGIVAAIKNPGCPCCGDKFYVVSDLCKDCADDLMESKCNG